MNWSEHFQKLERILENICLFSMAVCLNAAIKFLPCKRHKLLCLIPHTTYIVQPLDRIVFKPLKIFTIGKRLHSIRATQIHTLQSPFLESSSHLHGAGKENSQRKDNIPQKRERDATRRTQVFPSGQLEEREEVDVAFVRCGFCEVKW
jgi:hypothetical protein